MCGIAGIVDFSDRAIERSVIRKMTDRLAHRGPDAAGIYTDNGIALGHRRLSIIDVSEASNEPMWDHSSRYVIVFNGEIYNYRELKAKITDYPFKTKSDTEVVLAYYDLFGTACLKAFNGMFAFAIWDTLEKKLFMARDRMGKKPFFFFQQNQAFYFSSEMRSLIHSGAFKPELATDALSGFLQYQAALSHHTMIKDVQQLRAGHFAMYENGKFVQQSYWSWSECEPYTGSKEDAKRKAHELFMDSVRLRMIADVPIGAFLSGGIDSSLVVSCMAQLSTEPVNTFTLSFDEKQFDESDYARQIAEKYHTKHHRIVVKPDEFLSSLDEVLAAMDTPSGDGPNTYLVSKHTRQQGVKVALSGIGGDELFAGYVNFVWFHRLMKHQWFGKIPKDIRWLMGSGLRSISSGSRVNKFSHIIASKEWDWATMYPVFRHAYTDEEIRAILSTPTKTQFIHHQLRAIGEEIQWMGNISKSTIAEIETYTRDVLLRDTDQMSMAHALEVRAPFFDHRLVEFALSLPDAYKYPRTPKQFLVDAFASNLPENITARKKMGFVLPWSKWLRNELQPMANTHIEYIANRPEFNHHAVIEKWNRFKNGDTKILASRIWKLVVLSDWLQRNNV